MVALPFESLRVLDLSSWWAGPLVSTYLADYGAEVIKVEAIQRLDGWRGAAAATTPGKLWEMAPLFNACHRNKYEVTLDLRFPRGQEILKQLVKLSDVVLENYTPRVMPQLGLSYEELRKCNPQVIMVSVSGFGQTGSWKDYLAFAATVEALSGMSALTGYSDGPPLINGAIPGDSLAALHGVIAALLALRRHRDTGESQRIDLSQLEAATCAMGEAFLDYVMNRRLRPRQGNRDAAMAPHGCYPAQGEDQWVAIAVGSEEEWQGLCRAIGHPEWSQEERFSNPLSRWQNQEELDALIGEWTRQHDKYEAMRILQEVGVPAAPALLASETLNDPHLKAREFFQVVDRKEVGPKPYPAPSLRFSKFRARIRFPAPCLGEHNEFILGSLLGMPAKEVAELEKEQVIGKEPVGLVYGPPLQTKTISQDP